MELTDEIRSFSFSSPIQQELAKKSEEYFVLALLKHYFYHIGSLLHCADAPDLQDDQGIIGIEVTRAVSAREAQISGEFIKLHTTCDLQKNDLSKSLIERNGGKLTSFSVTYPLFTAEQIESDIKAILKKKGKKFKNYSTFQHVGFAVIVDTNMLAEIKENWCKWVEEAAGSLIKFDFVFLVCWDEMSYYNMRTRELIYTVFDKDMNIGLKKLARMTAEGLVDKNDPVWL